VTRRSKRHQIHDDETRWQCDLLVAGTDELGAIVLIDPDPDPGVEAEGEAMPLRGAPEIELL